MTKNKQLFYWGCEQEEALEKLKDEFTLAYILASFDPEKKIILKTNALDPALGSYLSQLEIKKWLHPVAYQSKKFFGLELN